MNAIARHIENAELTAQMLKGTREFGDVTSPTCQTCNDAAGRELRTYQGTELISRRVICDDCAEAERSNY